MAPPSVPLNEPLAGLPTKYPILYVAAMSFLPNTGTGQLVDDAVDPRTGRELARPKFNTVASSRRISPVKVHGTDRGPTAAGRPQFDLSANPARPPAARPGALSSLYPAADLNEALKIANGLEFGLGSAFWSTDTDEVDRAVRELQAGAVFVNGMTISYPELPFGGMTPPEQGAAPADPLPRRRVAQLTGRAELARLRIAQFAASAGVRCRRDD
ncbi:aldehyde dehydrogenase family protein [Arthrobacter sp. ISL-28]|uniref:aldehyde dehydrogenase family protein n=1 Tax=Arthrobacter sp. ISL-28 TaxID=2819108 RepID=UPI001BEB9B99|nr:aldehyde dehydrogenase family protein [Arthrobacter sp. ISL-28]MBT2523819.1 aldehyde dehydrogenase family protein [Arthrobacter sp. ISL-28]